MIKNKTLLTSALCLTLLSTISMAADFYSDTRFQDPILTPSLDTLLPTDEREDCMTIDDSTADVWNAGEICFSSDINSTTNSLRRRASLTASQDGLGDGAGAECVSAGDSAAANDSAGGLCLAADLNTSISGLANFAVANQFPAAGMQYLQAIFGDGSTLGDSAPVSSECVSVGGSISLAENSDGFCLASDLIKSTTAFAKFAVANGIPLVGIQFIQILFDDTGTSIASGTGTKCVSVGGSAAASGATAGFCLAADLSTSTAGFANFAIAHDLPVTDLQFLQVTYEDSRSSSGSLASQGAGAPVGAECISVEGSLAAVENPNGFCLVSDLIESSVDSADISIANDLAVSGMQFLQVKFAADGSLSELPSSPGGAECVSVDGSTASAGNPEGFCLVADLINSTIESANFTVANDLPVVAWEFLQVPSENVPPLVGSSNPAEDTVVPEGIVVSGFEELPFSPTPEAPDVISSSALLDSRGRVEGKTPFFHHSDQTNGIEIFSTPYWRIYPHLGLWVGR